MHRTALRRHVLDLEGWQGGALPYQDDSFDLVMCRQRLQMLGDRQAALREVRRVLLTNGRIEVSVWGSLARNPALSALVASLDRRAGVDVAAAVRWLCCLSEPEDVRALLSGARFERIRVATVRRSARAASVSALVQRSLRAFPVDAATAHLNERDRRMVIADVRAALAPWADANGVAVPTEVVRADASPAP